MDISDGSLERSAPGCALDLGGVNDSNTAMPALETLDFILIIFAYLLGSVSSAIVVCRTMGLADPRTQGSCNPGATNVLRVGGKRAAVITLLGDTLKGVLPVVVALWLQRPLEVLGLVGFAAFIGHLYPLFFGFRGGKGVATALGVLLAAAWQVGLATLGTWLIMATLFHISSLSALTAFTLAPLYAWLLTGNALFSVTILVLAVILIWRHRSNIRKLLAGTES